MERAVLSVVSNGSSTQDITHSGSWTPKAAIFQWSRANTSADTFQEHMSFGYGVTDGTNQRASAIASEDNQARGDTASLNRNNALIVTLNPTGTIETVDAVATFNSWLSNGIRITWTDQPAVNFYFTVILLGGDDITDVKVDTIYTTTTTGTKTYSSATFQADYGMFFCAPSLNENNPNVVAYFSLGMATGTSGNETQWCQSLCSVDNPVTMITRQYYDDTHIFYYFQTSLLASGYFTGFTSNGFTIYMDDASSTTMPIYFLLIKGGAIKVGTATEPDSVQQQTVTTNSNVELLGIFGNDISTSGTISNGNMWTSGWGDGTNQVCDVFEDQDNTANSIVVSRHDTDQIYLNMTANVTATSSTLDDEASDYSHSATNFILNWTNIGNARPYHYCTFGSSILHNEKTLTLRYAIDAKYNKTFTLRHDVRKQNNTTFTTRFDIRNLMSKTLTLRYDIIGKLTKTLTLLYNIEVELQHLEKTLTLRYDVREQNNNQLTLRYDIAEQIAKSLSLLYNISERKNKTLTLRHDIAEKINKQLTLLYNISQKNEKTLTLIYNLSQRIESTLTLRYDLLQKLDKQLTLLYDILEKKEVSLTLKYDIVGRLSKTLTLLYDIEVQGVQHFEKQLSLLYNIAEQKNKSFTFRYDLLQKLNKELTLLHHILEQKSMQTTLRYDIREQKQKELTLRYDIIGRLSKTLTLLYNIEVQGMLHLEKELSLLYNIMEKKSKQTTLRYDIRQSFNKSLTLRYNLLQQFAKQLTIRYDLIARMSKQLTTRYDIRQKLDRTLSLIYAIRMRNENQLTLRYDIIGRLQKTLTLIYNVESLIPHFVKTFSMRYDIREKKSQTLGLKYDILQKLSKTLRLKFRIYPKGYVEADFAEQGQKQKDMFGHSDHSWNILDHLSKFKWDKRKGWFIKKA